MESVERPGENPSRMDLAQLSLILGLVLTVLGILYYGTHLLDRWKKPEDIRDSWDELDETRKARYIENRGLFLIHTWKPSEIEGQEADVTVRLTQHHSGPLTDGTVEAVEYAFGKHFEEHTATVSDPENAFAWETSMYGPMLCMAKVYFSDGTDPLILERYINID